MIRVPPFQTSKASGFECSTPSGAQRLADIIEAAWRKVGHHNVRAWTVPARSAEGDRNTSRHDVRCNLYRGFPPVE